MSTEPSTEHVRPDPVHVEALGINFVWHNLMSAGEATRAAETILTSTDPAVWDAIAHHIPLDALVRAGRLREEKGVYAWGTDDERNETRFVTEWQEVQP